MERGDAVVEERVYLYGMVGDSSGGVVGVEGLVGFVACARVGSFGGGGGGGGVGGGGGGLRFRLLVWERTAVGA